MPNIIESVAYDIGVRTPATLFHKGSEKKWTVLRTSALLRSLETIKDSSREVHTKENLQILMDQIKGLDLDV